MLGYYDRRFNVSPSEAIDFAEKKGNYSNRVGTAFKKCTSTEFPKISFLDGSGAHWVEVVAWNADGTMNMTCSKLGDCELVITDGTRPFNGQNGYGSPLYYFN